MEGEGYLVEEGDEKWTAPEIEVNISIKHFEKCFEQF